MKNGIKKTLICIVLMTVVFVAYKIALNRLEYINYQEKIIEYEAKGDYSVNSEFLQTIDCAPIFDENSAGTYMIEFEIKVQKPGKICVYQQNGSIAKYSFYEYIEATENWKKFSLCVNPKLVNSDETKSMLAFYGEYGSGVIPSVRAINIYEVKDSQE